MSEKQGAVTLYQGLRFIDYGMGLTFDVCLSPAGFCCFSTRDITLIIRAAGLARESA